LDPSRAASAPERLPFLGKATRGTMGADLLQIGWAPEAFIEAGGLDFPVEAVL